MAHQPLDQIEFFSSQVLKSVLVSYKVLNYSALEL